LTNKTLIAFLVEAKKLISDGKKDFIKRTYTHPTGRIVRWKEALLDIGLTNPTQAWDEILRLSPGHYLDGPCEDTDRPNGKKDIWIFKKEVNGVQVYIKLKIDTRGCVCLSFHEAWY
jgi:hypothetical protein